MHVAALHFGIHLLGLMLFCSASMLQTYIVGRTNSSSLPCSGASLALEFGLASLAADELLLHSVPTGQHSAEAASSTACKAGTRRASVLSL